LAEAAKQTELKSGHPLKGLDIPSPAPGTNGHGKKDEDAPPVKEPPLLVPKFFDGKHFYDLLWCSCET
jgi:N-terminal acetyltransferase B complex non-catalytic subunit